MTDDFLIKVDVKEYLQLLHESLLQHCKNIENARDLIEKAEELHCNDLLISQKQRCLNEQDRVRLIKTRIEKLFEQRPDLTEKCKDQLDKCSNVVFDCIFQHIYVKK